MPQNWKTYNIAEFIEINPKVPLKKGIEYSFIEMKDLDANNKYALPSVIKELKGGARFKNGDTLFARITPCLENGKICQAKGLQDDLGFGSTEFLVFRGKENISDSDFIYYLSRSPYFRKFSEAKMIGTSGRQRVAKDAYENLDLQLPPLPEQKAIASILSALDDKIELNLQMNKTLEEMAMTLYKHWFVDFGPFQNGKFVESELGMIPEGWEVKQIRDLGKTVTGNTPSKKNPEYFGNGLPFVTPTDFKNYGKHILSAQRKLSSEGEQAFQSKMVPQNSVLVTCIGSDMGKVAITKSECLTNQQINSVVTEYPLYLYEFFKSSYKLLRTLAGDGTTMPIINKTNFESLNILLPNLNILSDFELKILDLDKNIASNSNENITLTKTRDTLLPKLISGEVRVKQAEQELKNVL